MANSYYQLIGASALRTAADRTLAAARENLALTEKRQAGGVATELEVNRAIAEVERALQSIADAELTTELASRALQTLTGVTPTGEIAGTSDDLHEEKPLGAWEGGNIDSLPKIAVFSERRSQAEAADHAADLALVPTISASAVEHCTNAPGFASQDSNWIVTVTAAWRLDVGTVGTIRAQSAAAEIARTREIAARRQALDQLHEDWFRIHSGISKSQATRAESRAAGVAVARARERYQQGAGTQLDLVQTERDAFSAEVSRIQADADLAYARAALRLDAGLSLEEENPK